MRGEGHAWGNVCDAPGCEPMSANSVTIRAATFDDVPTIVAFQLAMAWETESLSLEGAVVTRGVQAVLDDPAKGQYWLAEVDGGVAGVLLTIPEWSDWRNGTVLWLHSVYVTPLHRGQGVFRRLFEHVRGLVERSPELCGLRLYVDKRNAAAQAVYRSLGMTSEHYDLYEWLR